MHTETKQENNEGERALLVLMTSQRTKERGTGIYIRGFPRIMREAQLGITGFEHNLHQNKVKNNGGFSCLHSLVPMDM